MKEYRTLMTQIIMTHYLQECSSIDLFSCSFFHYNHCKTPRSPSLPFSNNPVKAVLVGKSSPLIGQVDLYIQERKVGKMKFVNKSFNVLLLAIHKTHIVAFNGCCVESTKTIEFMFAYKWKRKFSS